MNLIEANLSHAEVIADMHRDAYKEKFNKEQLNYIDLYLEETIKDINTKKVFITDNFTALIVCEDRTDPLLLNSTYHLITRIYVKPEYRGQGIAKKLVKHCQDTLGPLMGWDGKFYNIGEIQ